MARRKMFSDIEKREIIECYQKGNSLAEVGDMFNITIGAVHYILKKNNIDRRKLSDANTAKWTEEKRKAQSEKRKGIASSALGKTWQLKHIKKYPTRAGEKSHLWKGGKTKLSSKIRNSVEYKIWRKQVFERDNYSCVECGRKRKKGDRVIIDADHISPFSKILDDFNITFIEEAVSCEKLWDIENGRTLCRECHKKTDTYGVNLIKNA
ncbi:MAG TPA: hypothetical protein PLB74_03225 [Candidatus Paceibacterota bacterium]|nr:hypothetical protein [Candidatus Paceibacterota bacterium]